MADDKQELGRKDFEGMIISKAWQDPSFKEELLRNPKAVLARELEAVGGSQKMPEDLETTVLEETSNLMYMVLSKAPPEVPEELDLPDKPEEVSRDLFELKIAVNAWNDPEYKSELLKQPKAVFERELQELDSEAQLPDDLTIKVMEETSNRAFLVLPVNPQEVAETELSDEQLEAVAGGIIPVFVAGVAVVAAAVNTAAAVNAAVSVNAAVNINEAVNVHHVETEVKGKEESPW